MTKKRKISFSMYLLSTLVSLFFAIIYLTRSEFMPYHADALSMPWKDVSDEFQILLLALQKVAGGGWLTASVSLGVILFIPYRKGEKWSNWALLLIGLSSSVTSLLVTLFVKFNTPASPPWLAALLGIILLLTAFTITLNDEIKRQK